MLCVGAAAVWLTLVELSGIIYIESEREVCPLILREERVTKLTLTGSYDIIFIESEREVASFTTQVPDEEVRTQNAVMLRNGGATQCTSHFYYIGKAKIPLTTNARLHRDLNRCHI